jgi:outer membrane lipoprotein-sorting protein
MKLFKNTVLAALALATAATLAQAPAKKDAAAKPTTSKDAAPAKDATPAKDAAAKAPASPDANRQLHWKSEMTGTNVPPGMTSETWLKGERVRTVMQTPVGESVVVMKDKVVYMKASGMAMKMPVDPNQQKGPMPKPTDYATKLEEILKGGKKVGTEKIDGEDCDKWVVKPEGAQGEETLWISPSLHFPRRISVKTDAGEIIVNNKDIQTKVTLDDKLFEPDPSVTYQDMSAMRGMAPAAQPPKQEKK